MVPAPGFELGPYRLQGGALPTELCRQQGHFSVKYSIENPETLQPSIYGFYPRKLLAGDLVCAQFPVGITDSSLKSSVPQHQSTIAMPLVARLSTGLKPSLTTDSCGFGVLQIMGNSQ